jgi:hypothetical protein
MAIGRAMVLQERAAARVLHVLSVNGEACRNTWGTERQAMTGLGPFCLVAPRMRAVAAGAAGADFPTRSAEPARNAAPHSSARPAGNRSSGRNALR